MDFRGTIGACEVGQDIQRARLGVEMKRQLKRKGNRVASSFLLILAVLFSLLPEDGFSAGASGGEEDLCARYISVLEQGVDVFEPIYTESETVAPESGFYDIRKYGNWTHPRNEPYHTLCIIPGNGQVVLSYAVLLKYTDKETFGKNAVSRRQLFDHARKAIRWICLTSAYVEDNYPFLPEVRQDLASGKNWHRDWGLRQDLLGYLSVGTALLWEDLGEETRDLFKQVAMGGALKGRLARTADKSGNGNHDQVKQDLASTAGAAFLMPDHPDHAKTMEAVFGAGLDMVSTSADAVSDAFVDGRKLRELAESANLLPDYSSFHHSHPSLWYGVDLIFEGRSYVEILAGLTSHKVPASFDFDGNGFDGVYRYAMTLANSQGVLTHLRSPEYDSCYGAGLLAFCYGGTLKRDPAGAFLEARAADVLCRHTKAVGQYDYHRGSWAKAAMAFLLHRLHPGGPYGEAGAEDLKSLQGVRYYRKMRALVQRSDDKLATFVWGGDGKVGGGGPGAHVSADASNGIFHYSSTESLSGAVLAHRPITVYGAMAFAALACLFAGAFFCRKENTAVAAAAFSAAGALLVSGIATGCIDFFFTLPERLPGAEVPRWILPLANIAAVVLLFLSMLAVNGRAKKSTSQAIGLSMVSGMFAVPVILFSMTRTPWRDLAHTPLIFGAEWLQITALIAIASLSQIVFAKGPIGKKASLLLLLVAAYSTLAFFILRGSDTTAPFYLRLLSIHNMNRLYVLAALAVIFGLVAAVLLVLKKRNMAVLFVAASCVLLAASVAIFVLCYGRFSHIPEVSEARFEASDDGFSTSGEAITPAAIQKQAFFCYESGPCITFIDVQARGNGILSWSGLPTMFYQRDGFVPPAKVAYEAGQSEIASMRPARSPWWCLEGQTGLYCRGGEGTLGGRRGKGANWARTESYIDNVDTIAMSPIHRRFFTGGQTVAKIAAGIYPGASVDLMKSLGEKWFEFEGESDLCRTVLASAGKNDGCVVASANLSNEPSVADLSLKWGEWAPLLDINGEIQGGTNRVRFELGPFETYRDHCRMFVFVESPFPITARRMKPGRFEILASANADNRIVVKWDGPLVSALKATSQGEERGLDPAMLMSQSGVKLDFREKIEIAVESEDLSDRTPPFVTIDSAILKKDTRDLQIVVKAADKSDLDSIALYKDGSLVGTKRQPPFSWTVTTDSHIHSFYARAIDSSPMKNAGKSYVYVWKERM